MASDKRRCTASQFFLEDEENVGLLEKKSTTDRVVELLNEASLLTKDSEKIEKLRIVQELIVNKEPALLDNFLDEVIAFQSDKSVEVKRMIITFMEDACKKDPDILPKIVGNLAMLLHDENIKVVKKVILVMSHIHRTALQWVCKAKTVEDSMNHAWQFIQQMKKQIMELIDSDNDGIRTHAIKFLEDIVITLSEKTEDSEIPKGNQDAMSLDQIPENHNNIKVKKMEEEGKKAFEALITFEASPHISSVNLMTVMGSLTVIAKQRPQFMARVVQGFEALHVNLPPTLAKSQVSSVRKNLKMHLLALLRHQASCDFQPQITTLLTDLGATQTEVMKAMPKIDESRKRKARNEGNQLTKKPKMTPEATPARDDDDDYGTSPFIGLGTSSQPAKKSVATDDQKQIAIDVTADDLIGRLTPQNVADLVLLSMVMLPDTMPPHFQSTYTPIAAAGTQAQIKHLSRLLATQLTLANLGKGYEEMQEKLKKEPEEEPDEFQTGAFSKNVIQTVVGGSVAKDELKSVVASVPQPVPPPAPAVLQATRKGIRGFKLSAITKPLDRGEMDKMAMSAVRRILKADSAHLTESTNAARTKIVTGLISQFGGALKDELQQFIFADLRNRADLAFSWLYQEYANFQGYNLATSSQEKRSVASYDECLTRLLNALLIRPDQREGLFSRLYLEAPYITPNAIQVLKKYCQEENRIYLGMTTLKELIIKRPCVKLEFLDVLLDFTFNEKAEVRNNAIRVTKKLHEKPDLASPIEKYALYYLKFLLQPHPPSELLVSGAESDEWTEENIKLCLYLYLSLLPVNHKLIHELANVYTATTADVKRTILRILENPVKGMGMQSPQLLLLVENCPKGAETLVTRVIHILTDKAPPSKELVERVRDLYHKRVSDVRFLIPVLNGLTQEEVISALPKLIKLNPVVVREVFNRLLGTHVANDANFTSPLTPAELLIALHNIDTTKVDMKTIIKATNLCFAEKNIYTQEVLALVMQHLMEQNPLPTLFMRTVIQSLAMYPKLIGLVLNIMQRLIVKQVWKQKKVWEGFVRCCQRTKPQSFQVLLQLPAPQLKNAFEIAPDLREPLLAHVQSFTPHQRAHLHKAIMIVLEKDPLEEQKAALKAKREEEEKIAAQEKLYQQKLEEERKRQIDKRKQLQSLVESPKINEKNLETDKKTNGNGKAPMTGKENSKTLTILGNTPTKTMDNESDEKPIETDEADRRPQPSKVE